MRMDMDLLHIRLMQKVKTLQSRLRVLEPEDGETDAAALMVRPDGRGVLYERRALPSEGEGLVSMRATAGEAVATGNGMLRTMDMLMRRERTIDAQKYDISTPPSWSVSVDDTGRSIIVGLGLDLRQTVNPRDDDWSIDGTAHVRPIHHPRVREGIVSRRGPACHLRMTINSGAVGDEGRSWTYDDTGRNPHIVIHSTSPASAETIGRCIGGPLARLVALPGCDHTAVIRAARCFPSGVRHELEIDLEPRRRALAKAPEGVSTDWLEANV